MLMGLSLTGCPADEESMSNNQAYGVPTTDAGSTTATGGDSSTTTDGDEESTGTTTGSTGIATSSSTEGDTGTGTGTGGDTDTDTETDTASTSSHGNRRDERGMPTVELQQGVGTATLRVRRAISHLESVGDDLRAWLRRSDLNQDRGGHRSRSGTAG
jgi:hypothetical protein